MGGTLLDYDHYIVTFSGGKDSTACFLWLLEQGVDRSKIELWHHLIDGDQDDFMDWTITKAYCEAFARAFNVPIYFSWRIGGFRAEMLKENSIPKDIMFETPFEGLKRFKVSRAKPNTRRKFPITTSNLALRWCSAQLKIDVGRKALRHQERFTTKIGEPMVKILYISGERVEESISRSHYAVLEPNPKCDLREGKTKRRYIDDFRPVHAWTTREVWDIIAKYKVNPHPCYKVGFGRCSCAGCIFGNARQFASYKVICPEKFQQMLEYEREFDCTIHTKKRKGKTIKIFLDELVEGAGTYNIDPEQANLLNSKDYTDEIIMKKWEAPSGVNGELTGPQ